MAGHAILLTVPFRDASLVCRTVGSANAPWLVMCHGMGLDSRNLLPLAERLAPEWRVLLWDMPGHGQSPPIKHYSMDTFADALIAILDALDVQKAVLFGFSFGGTAAQYAVRREPDRFRALIAYGCYAPFHQQPPIKRSQVGGVLALYRLLSWKRIQADFAQACAVTKTGQTEVARALARSSKAVFVGMVHALLESFKPEAHVTFDVPMLLIRGEQDVNAGQLAKAAAGLRAAHPCAQEVVIPNAGHCAHNDAFNAVADAVSSFLDPLCRANWSLGLGDGRQPPEDPPL